MFRRMKHLTTQDNFVDNIRVFFTHNLSYISFWWKLRRRRYLAPQKQKNTHNILAIMHLVLNRFDSLATKGKKACRSKRTRRERWTMCSLLVVLFVNDYFLDFSCIQQCTTSLHLVLTVLTVILPPCRIFWRILNMNWVVILRTLFLLLWCLPRITMLLHWEKPSR